MPFFVPLSVLKESFSDWVLVLTFFRMETHRAISPEKEESSQLPVNGTGTGPKTTAFAFAAESMSAGFQASLAAGLGLG